MDTMNWTKEWENSENASSSLPHFANETDTTFFMESAMHNPMVLMFNFWTLGVVMPVIAVFGILANLASIVVLTRRCMRSSTINIYLAGLSIYDGLLLLMTLLLYPSLSFCESMNSDPRSLWCKYFFYSAPITFPLSLIMQSGSVWTLTAITVDRFIAITWPLRSRDWCTSRRANFALAAIAGWSIVYNLPTFFELTLIDMPQNDSHVEDTMVVLSQTDLRTSPVYVAAYKGYCYLIFMLLVPGGLMIVLNVFVTLSVRRAYRLRRAMSGREEKERRCTVMAVLVVVTFLVFNSLAFVNNVVEMFTASSDGEQMHARSQTFQVLVSIGNLLVALNSATNFLIYCALGLRFRLMFCKIFCMKTCRPTGVNATAVGAASNNEKSYQTLTVRYSARNTPTASPCRFKRRAVPEHQSVAPGTLAETWPSCAKDGYADRADLYKVRNGTVYGKVTTLTRLSSRTALVESSMKLKGDCV